MRRRILKDKHLVATLVAIVATLEMPFERVLASLRIDGNEVKEEEEEER